MSAICQHLFLVPTGEVVRAAGDAAHHCHRPHQPPRQQKDKVGDGS